jgi:hypothetical protein
MRARSALVLALLLVPAVASAQARRPRIGGGARPEPAPLGPQPEVVARAQAMVRSRLSVETYPMISRVYAPGFSGGRPVSSWTSFGTGTHVDYRHSELLSSTLDITASFMGGPAVSETIEAGFRLRSEDWMNRFRPFADVRVGFEHSSDQYSSSTGTGGIGVVAPAGTSMRYSRGFGAIAGAGTEFALTNSWSLMSELSAMRANMSSYRYSFTSVGSPADSYRMTTYRLALGLRYNRVRMVNVGNSSAR